MNSDIEKTLESNPDIELDVRQVFDIDVDLKVPGFSESNDYVPNIDDDRLLLLVLGWY